jgi:uncharacterized protein (TIGR03067 family)
MKRRFLLTALAILAAAPAPKADPRPHEVQLQGTWILAALVHKGHLHDLPPEARKLRWVFKANRLTVMGPKQRQEGTFALDAAKQALDLVLTRPIRARYLLNGDTLQVCFDSENQTERPASFRTRGNHWTLMVFQRRRLDDPHEQAIVHAQQTLAGAWQLVAVECGGKREPITPSDYVFREDELALVQNGREVGTAPYHVEPLVNPKQIDMPRKGVFVPSIYKIEDDVLTICSAGPGEELPRSFDTAPGCKRMLTILKRRPR